MIVGGNGAVNDVEIIDLKDQNSACSKPKDCPLEQGSIGTFMDNAALVCEDDDSGQCFFYDNNKGRVMTEHPMIHFKKALFR